MIAGSPERRQSRGRRLAGGRGRDGDRAMKLLSPDELEAALRDIGARRYHRLHPFHGLLHGGKCTKGQVQAWALNRYYYQAMIPIKDASLIARCEDPALRREWRSRLVDHDGVQEGDGGIARWLKLTDGLGLDRDYVTSLRGFCPAPGSRSTPMCISCARRRCWRRSRPRSPSCSRPPSSASAWPECWRTTISSTRETLAYFDKRPPQAQRDADFALDYVKRNAKTPEQQQAVLAALEFKCGVLWSMLDALCLRLCGAEAGAAGRLRAGGPDDDKAAPTIADSAHPRLPRGVRLMHNEAQGGWVLLAPERVFKADAIAAEILKRCTGEATVEAIVDDLAKAFDAPRERIHADVVKLLGGLADKKLLEL